MERFRSVLRGVIPGVVLSLLLALGFAWAQQGMRGVQLTQSASGPITVSSTGAINLAGPVTHASTVTNTGAVTNSSTTALVGGATLTGHLLPGGGSTAVLTGSNCQVADGGTFDGNDTVGTITGSSSAYTSCVVTFATAYAAAPICNVVWASGPLAAMSWTTSTTALTITQTSTASTTINYFCMGAP